MKDMHKLTPNKSINTDWHYAGNQPQFCTRLIEYLLEVSKWPERQSTIFTIIRNEMHELEATGPDQIWVGDGNLAVRIRSNY